MNDKNIFQKLDLLRYCDYEVISDFSTQPVIVELYKAYKCQKGSSLSS